MIELLYTSLLIFGLFLIFVFCFPVFNPIKIFMLAAQLILCFILFSNNFYKKHSLWKEQSYINIHEVPYYPIKSIDLTSYKELSFEKLKDKKFSIIRTEQYSNECLENYFIASNECPITNIIIEDRIYEKYENYSRLDLTPNSYLYYTNNDKFEKLYDSSDKHLILQNMNLIIIKFSK